MYLGDGVKEVATINPAKHFSRALLVGVMVAAGFVVLFGLAGVIIAVGASFVGDLLQWLGLAIGIGLTIAGAWMVGGGRLYTGVAASAASHIGNPARVSMNGYFLFGISDTTAAPT